MNESIITNPIFIISHPFRSRYYNFSKQEKKQRKYYKIQQSAGRESKTFRTFNREWVQEVTGLDGDKLTDFIAYCDFSIDFLSKNPLYVIRERLIVKLMEFEQNQKSKLMTFY